MRRQRQGFALLVAMVFALILLGLGAALVAPLGRMREKLAADQRGVAAGLLADGALEAALSHLRAGEDAPEEATRVDTPTGTAAYQVEAVPGGYLIHAQGSVELPGGAVQIRSVWAAVALGGAPAGGGPRPVRELLVGRTRAVADCLGR